MNKLKFDEFSLQGKFEQEKEILAKYPQRQER